MKIMVSELSYEAVADKIIFNVVYATLWKSQSKNFLELFST